jgi:hypothetical protein
MSKSFIDIDARPYDGTPEVQAKRLQFAYRIDTSLVNPLSNLPPAIAVDPSSLAARNLLRGWRLNLPSGQQVARAIGVTPLSDRDILIGQAVDQPDAPLPNITSISPVFAGNCPLWTYILAEAMHYRVPTKIPTSQDVTVQTPQLGPVGGRIVAEVFLGLMFGDPHSWLSLDPGWRPASGPDYRLRDLVGYALGL